MESIFKMALIKENIKELWAKLSGRPCVEHMSGLGFNHQHKTN